MAGRALLIAAWILVVGGIAGGAGYLHSLGPPPGPPDLSSPEAAPEAEAPPRLEAPSALLADGDAEPPPETTATEDSPPESEAPAGPPRLPALGENFRSADPVSVSAPPAVETLPALAAELAEAEEPSAPDAVVLPPLAEFAAAGEGATERFEPEMEWPVTRPELHGPMPMAERQAIDLPLPGGQQEPEGQPEHEVEPQLAEMMPTPAVAEAEPEPGPASDAPELVPPPAEVAALSEDEAARPEVFDAEDTAGEQADEAPAPAPLPQAPVASEEPPAADVHAEPPALAVAETVEMPQAPVQEPPAEAGEEAGGSATAPPPPVEAAHEPTAPELEEAAEEQQLALVMPPAVEAPAASVVAPPPPEAPAVAPPGSRPVVSVVVVGLGLSSGATEAAIQSLPAAVTLSFSPYSGRLQDWVALARAAGHEVLLDLPMEPADFPNSDPGPQALMTGLPTDANLERLDWVLSRADNYVGVGSFMGSRFAADAAAMRPVLQEIANRGLIYLDNGQAVGNVARSLGAEIGLPMLVSDGQVDSMAARQAIDAELSEIEARARADGSAIAVGTAYPVTIERLAVWTRSLADRGIALAPASAMVGR